MKQLYESNAQLVEVTAKRNSSLQGAYLILAARALGLDCGVMSSSGLSLAPNQVPNVPGASVHAAMKNTNSGSSKRAIVRRRVIRHLRRPGALCGCVSSAPALLLVAGGRARSARFRAPPHRPP